MNSMMKSVLVWVGIIVLVVVALRFLQPSAQVQEIPFSTFITEGNAGRFKGTLVARDVGRADDTRNGKAS